MGARLHANRPSLLVVTVFLILSAAVTCFAETDVTGMTRVSYTNAVYDRANSTTSYNVTVTNTSSQALFAPFRVVVKSSTPSTVTVANADGTTADGKPYFDYGNLFGDGKLDPGEVSSARRCVFNNPQRSRFTVNTAATGVILTPTPTVPDLTGNLAEVLSTGSTSGIAEMATQEQPLQVFNNMDTTARSLIAASLQERGILLPEGLDLNTITEVWGRICLQDPVEGLICSPVLLRKDADGNWKIAQW